MKINYSPKIVNIPEEHKLKAISGHTRKDKKSYALADDFVISKNVDHSILSVYSDNIWDMTPYNNQSGKCRFVFANPSCGAIAETYIQQMKWLMICLMYFIPASLSTASLLKFFKVIRCMAYYCQENGIREIYTIFSDHIAFKRYIKVRKVKTTKAISLINMILHIAKADPKITTINVDNESKLIEINSQFEKIKLQNTAQTLPIPSRIYLKRIQQFDTFLNDYIKNIQNISNLIEDCSNDSCYGRTINAQKSRGRSKGVKISHKTGKQSLPFSPDFSEALIQHDLQDFAKAHEFNSILTFSKFISKVRYICKEQIHLFTGMRNDEVKLLRCNCLVKESMSWGDSYFIEGITTKTSKSRKISRWVTCDSIKPAILIAESITKPIAKKLNYKPQDCALFLVHSSLFGYKYIPKPDEIMQTHLLKYNPKSIIIEKSDIDELQKIILDIDIEKYPFLKEGHEWHFTSHQYRRSLAVYGSNSGLIEYSSLKYQLKHITNSMTLYYEKGSARAKNILGDLPSNHFINDFQYQKPISDAIVYINDYLFSDENLHGSAGKMLERSKPTADENSILLTRKNTEKRFKNGEIAFKETPLGACTSPDPCDSRININFTECISCPKAILKPSKVNLYAKELEQSLKVFPEDSVEYRLEKNQLSDLKRIASKF